MRTAAGQILTLLACYAWAALASRLPGQEPVARGHRDDRDPWRLVVPSGEERDRREERRFRKPWAATGGDRPRPQPTARVALGAIVEADGYLVTKASVLEGKIACRFRDGTVKAARIVGQGRRHGPGLAARRRRGVADRRLAEGVRRRPAVSWPPAVPATSRWPSAW